MLLTISLSVVTQMFRLVCLLIFFVGVLAEQGCPDVGTLKAFYDPSCSDPHVSSLGCNAGGMDQNCRFCYAAPERCTATNTNGEVVDLAANVGNANVASATANVTLIFDEEFNTLDFSTWEHESTLAGGGNREFEWYVNNRSNSFVKDGILHIRPTLSSNYMDIWDAVDINGGTPADQCTDPQFYGCKRDPKASGNVINPIRSARLRSVHSFSFRYGRVEVRARMPKGDWLWPAIWFLPTDDEYGPWPASGEIDLVESRGNDASYAGGGVNQFGSTLHFGPHFTQDPWNTAHAVYNLPSGDFSEDFHTFGLIWTDKSITTYIGSENNTVLHVDCSTESMWKRGGYPSSYQNPWQYSDNLCAPFDKKFYFILNLAVGGTANYFPDGVGNKPWSNSASDAVNQFWNNKAQWLPTWDLQGDGSSMLIDYIRVWQ